MKTIFSASPIRDALKGACYFVALGPLLGLLGVALQFSANAVLEGDVSRLENALAASAIALMFGIPYFFGLVPAAVCGLICGPFRPAFSSWSACVAAGLAGGLLSAWWPVSFYGRPQEERLLFLVAGFVAGLLCSRIFAVRASARVRSAAS